MKKLLLVFGLVALVGFAGVAYYMFREGKLADIFKKGPDLTSQKDSNWPGWIPEVVPVYTYGVYAKDTPFGDEEGVVYFKNLDMEKDPYNSYIKDLENKGWVEDEGWMAQEFETEEMIEADDAPVIYMNHEDGYFLSYSVDDLIDWVVLTISKDGEEGDSDSAERESRTETIESGDVKITQSNTEIPKDYPKGFCSLYEPSNLTMSQVSSSGSVTVYTLSLTTKDSVRKVRDYYNNYNPTSAQMLLEDRMSVIILDSEDGNSNCNITVVYDEENNVTNITIGLSVEK